MRIPKKNRFFLTGGRVQRGYERLVHAICRAHGRVDERGVIEAIITWAITTWPGRCHRWKVLVVTALTSTALPIPLPWMSRNAHEDPEKRHFFRPEDGSSVATSGSFTRSAARMDGSTSEALRSRMAVTSKRYVQAKVIWAMTRFAISVCVGPPPRRGTS